MKRDEQLRAVLLLALVALISLLALNMRPSRASIPPDAGIRPQTQSSAFERLKEIAERELGVAKDVLDFAQENWEGDYRTERKMIEEAEQLLQEGTSDRDISELRRVPTESFEIKSALKEKLEPRISEEDVQREIKRVEDELENANDLSGEYKQKGCELSEGRLGRAREELQTSKQYAQSGKKFFAMYHANEAEEEIVEFYRELLEWLEQYMGEARAEEIRRMLSSGSLEEMKKEFSRLADEFQDLPPPPSENPPEEEGGGPPGGGIRP